MLLNSEEESNKMRTPVYASLALTFAGIGDAFLYPFLPVNNLTVGVPLYGVGILLSINRFVRIFSNTWMVYLFSKYGLRMITILAVSMALLSTAGYAVSTNVFLWLMFRVAWGLSFSAMRISTLAYALQNSKHGFALGLTRGIQELGPMIALFIAPFLLTELSNPTIFLSLALISLPALFFAWGLPKVNDRTPLLSRKTVLQFPSTFNAITFVSALLIDGIIVIVLGTLFLHHVENISIVTATTLAALYLGFRRVCLVVFSPVGGWIADRIGLSNVFNISLGSLIIGLCVLVTGYLEVGSVIVFSFYSVNSAITPGALTRIEIHPLAAVAQNATWKDIGAAIGTFTGGLLLGVGHLNIILTMVTSCLILLFVMHLSSFRKARNFLYLWK